MKQLKSLSLMGNFCLILLLFANSLNLERLFMYALRVAGEMASLAKNTALCKRTSLAGVVAALRV